MVLKGTIFQVNSKVNIVTANLKINFIYMENFYDFKWLSRVLTA